MLCFVYIPYAFAEGIHLSGIMAILFCGIVMSQYAHYNLSPGYYIDIWPWYEVFIPCKTLDYLIDVGYGILVLGGYFLWKW